MVFFLPVMRVLTKSLGLHSPAGSKLDYTIWARMEIIHVMAIIIIVVVIMIIMAKDLGWGHPGAWVFRTSQSLFQFQQCQQALKGSQLQSLFQFQQCQQALKGSHLHRVYFLVSDEMKQLELVGLAAGFNFVCALTVQKVRTAQMIHKKFLLLASCMILY